MRAKETTMQRIPKSLDNLLREIQDNYEREYGDRISITDAGKLLVIEHKNRKRKPWGLESIL